MSILGPFIGSGVHPNILNEYDLIISKATKVRSTLRVESQLGTFAVNITNISQNQAKRMAQIIKFLEGNHFPVAPIILNKYGEEFIPTKNGLIYLTKWIEGRNIKLNYNPHLMLSITILAKMHNLGFNYQGESIDYPAADEIYIKKAWGDSLDWLKRYQKGIKKKSSTTTFEQNFLRYIPFIIEWSEEAIEHLNQWVIQYNSILELRRTITHGKFHHRNTIITENEKMYVLDFEHATIDTPIRDLAYFIRHYISNKDQQLWAKEWLSAYQNRVTLNKREQKLLVTFLLFPERLINLAKRYDNKEAGVAEEEYLKKLQVRWVQMKELLWLIDQY